MSTGQNQYGFESLADGVVRVCGFCQLEHPNEFDCLAAMLDESIPEADFEPAEPDIDDLTNDELAHVMSTMGQEVSAWRAQQNFAFEEARGGVEAHGENNMLSTGGIAIENVPDGNELYLEASMPQGAPYNPGRYGTPPYYSTAGDSNLGGDFEPYYDLPLESNVSYAAPVTPKVALMPGKAAAEHTASGIGAMPPDNGSTPPRINHRMNDVERETMSKLSHQDLSRSVDPPTKEPFVSSNNPEGSVKRKLEQDSRAVFQTFDEDGTVATTAMAPGEFNMPRDSLAAGEPTTVKPTVSEIVQSTKSLNRPNKERKRKAHSTATSAKALSSTTAATDPPDAASLATAPQATASADTNEAPDASSAADSEFFSTIKEAEYWFQLNREPKGKPDIDGDDYETFGECQILGKARDLFQMLETAHGPPKEE
ncbi:Hypothetical predicted protein [Lecanosticta acicola]|uniref:Uncharacterized protein n=1 Tax=Lecanosticta acicola TaxID=111012 RepID=A0AAI8YXW4_9PEZI|nr:Hypothetical predicted protein [Lecanosticta acicola]